MKKITYFYKAVKNGRLSKKLKVSGALDPETECIVIPCYPEEFPLIANECLYYTVETDREKKTVTLSSVFPKFREMSGNAGSYIASIKNVEVDKCSLVCNVREMSFSEDTGPFEKENYFGLLMPEKAMKFALREIRFLQEECFGFKPEKFFVKEFGHRYLFLSKAISVTLEYKKKTVNEEFLKACVSYPSAPVIHYYLKHSNGSGSEKLKQLCNREFCHKDDLKEFFAEYGIKYSRRFLRKTSSWWMNIPNLLLLMDRGYSSKRKIYFLLGHTGNIF